MQLTCLTCDSGTEVAGEQGDYYDPLFTYWEGDEASYFVISEDFEGGAADVGPSGVGASKDIPMALSSRGWVTEPSASEGEPNIPAMEAVRIDEILYDIASSASSATAKVSFMEPVGVSVAIEEVSGDIIVEAVEARTNHTPC